jgi:nucleoid-associated protein YgaU
MPRYLTLALAAGLSLFLFACPSAPKPPEQKTVAAPAFTPEAGTFTDSVSVEIKSATEGAEIRYTLDGSDPSSTSGTVYSGPVKIDKTATLAAVAYLKDWLDSPIVKATYSIAGTVAPVTFAPEPGTYDHVVMVKLQSATTGAEIYYTTDGSDPSADNGTRYAGSVDVSTSTVIKAIGVLKGWTDSSVSSAAYALVLGTVVSPTFSLTEGSYRGAQSVEITTDTEGARIRYTTDGSIPTPTNGREYEGPVSVSSSLTLRAIGYKKDYADSVVSSVRYVIQPSGEPVTDEEIAAARDAIARAKEADADYYDPDNYRAARSALDDALTVRMADPDKAREHLTVSKEKAEAAFINAMERAAADLEKRMAALQEKLLAQGADKFLPSEYSRAVAGRDEAKALYDKGDLAGARARAYDALKAMTDLSTLLDDRIAWIRVLKRDTEQYLKEAEAADAGRWAPDAKNKANDLYLRGLEAYQGYRLDDAEENYGQAREAAKDALRLARDNRAKTSADEKAKTEALRQQAMKALEDASELTVVNEDGTVVKPKKWSGQEFLNEIEKLKQERERQKKENEAGGDQSFAVPSASGTVVLADESGEDLLTQAQELWKLGLQEEAKENYAKAQEYYQEALRYVEVYKSYAVKGVYTVRLIPELRDCLWRISGYDFIYGDPRLWPKIWRRNRKLIQNPDLIYPGWLLVIPPR